MVRRGDGRMRVTVTIPMLNGSEYLPGCLSNLSSQSYRDFEILFVVDHRSTKDTISAIDSYSKEMDNVRFIIQNDDLGLAGARNIGIDEARGDIIWFLDVDDHPYPSFLEEMVRILDDNDADIVFCNHFEHRKRIVPEIPDYDYKVRKIDHDYALAHFMELPIYSWSRIQKKSIFKDGTARFIHRPAAEDIEQTIRSIFVSDRIYYYEKPLYVYYKTNNTAVKRNRDKEIESLEETARSLVSLIGDSDVYPYNEFRKQVTERVMRQSAFSKYRLFSKSYRISYAHTLLEGMPDKTREMRVYELSKLLYYLAIYPYTHFIWDSKEGMWDRIDVKRT